MSGNNLNIPDIISEKLSNGPKMGQKWAKNEYYPFFILPAMPLDSVGSRISSAK